MDLDRKYVLGDVVANDGESKSFRARELATGREVLVHIVYGGRHGAQEPLLNAVLQYSMQASAEKRRRIIEIDEHKGMPYAVTEILAGFHGLRNWIERERGPAQPAGPPPEPDPKTRAGRWQVPGAVSAATSPKKPAGEFTALFRAAVGDPSAPPPPPAPPPEPEAAQAPVPAPPPTPVAAVEAPPVKESAGEFTRWFSGGPPLVTNEPAPHEWMSAPPPAAPSVPSTPSQAPGSFTGLFQSTTTQPPAPAPTPPSQPASAGEFTRWFSAAPVTPAGENLTAPAPPPPAPGAPGEFTRMFTESPLQAPPAAPQPAAPQPAARPPAGGPSEFTRYFSGPVAGGTPPETFATKSGSATGAFQAVREPEIAPPPAAAGPGEYTALFGTPAFGVDSSAAPVAAPPPAPGLELPGASVATPQMPGALPSAPAKSPLVPILIVLGVLLLLCVAVIVYLLLRK